MFLGRIFTAGAGWQSAELLPWSESSGGCPDHSNTHLIISTILTHVVRNYYHDRSVAGDALTMPIHIWLRAWHQPRPWSGVSQWGHGMGLGRDGQIQSQPQGWREERTLGFLSDLIATYIIGTGPDTSHIMILALHWLMLLLIWVLYIATYIIGMGPDTSYIMTVALYWVMLLLIWVLLITTYIIGTATLWHLYYIESCCC